METGSPVKRWSHLHKILYRLYALDARAEKAYLNIIGALVNLILGTSSGGQKHSIFNNQAAIISTLLGYYEGKYGISSTNLESKFAAANRSIKE
ncbi:hypothetical protein AAH678_19910 [Sodalis endosymbiont of Spalangia cameroni]|uniref:hypothetical protein n=1 Tax=Sodalis praecaptivus TaxID=1239307 RepID=UPI0031F907D9